MLENVVVKKLVNDVNITELLKNTLFKNSTTSQVVSGTKSFKNVGMEVLTSESLVDGLNFSGDAFVRLNADQDISGKMSFLQTFSCKALSVAGKLDLFKSCEFFQFYKIATVSFSILFCVKQI